MALQSADHGSWGPLGPLWPNSNEAKRGQVGPPELVLGQIPRTPKMAIKLKEPHFVPRTQGTQFSHNGHIPSRLQPWPLEVTFIKGFPLKIRETPNPTQWIQVFKNQGWCVYGIIYYYGPFFLRNPMVIVSGPN
ncbi:hypothetical protein O181_005156 [Austropuccinia psidii MF-1]|uniref:Uncharacterized protein n=1 Tax=Austropuccinia psidii MF-1 TaxID=1389203 RepID=A0A9Q3BIB8_9BASI|nr:hypothetical protein [Austropuccinia psidii MF-1]